MTIVDHAGIGALALSVIQTAIIDATHPRQPDLSAVAFLTETSGSWAKSFEAWCAVADLTPEWAREKCREIVLGRLSEQKAKSGRYGRFSVSPLPRAGNDPGGYQATKKTGLPVASAPHPSRDLP